MCRIRRQNQKPDITGINSDIIFWTPEAITEKLLLNYTWKYPTYHETKVHYRFTRHCQWFLFLACSFTYYECKYFVPKCTAQDCLKNTFNYDQTLTTPESTTNSSLYFILHRLGYILLWQGTWVTQVIKHNYSKLKYSTILLKHLWNKTGNQCIM